MVSAVQTNWGGVPAALPGLATSALTIYREACSLPALCQCWVVRLVAEVPRCAAVSSLSRDTRSQSCVSPSYPGAGPWAAQGLEQPSFCIWIGPHPPRKIPGDNPAASGVWIWKMKSLSSLPDPGRCKRLSANPRQSCQDGDRENTSYYFLDACERENMAWLEFCLATLALQPSKETALQSTYEPGRAMLPGSNPRPALTGNMFLECRLSR